MADEIDRDREADSQINTDDLDLGTIDKIELDFPTIDGDEGIDKGSGRHPDTSKKRVVMDAAAHLAGGVKAIGMHELKKAMPDAALIASDVTATLDDIKALREDLSKQLAPITRSFVSAGRKLMPAAEGILPKKIYQAIEKKLKEKEEEMRGSTYQTQSKEQMETAQIKAELAEIFQEQTALQQERDRSNAKEVMVDRAIDSIRHKQTTVQLTHLYDAMRSTELFHKTQHLAFMKKSLELKYRHIFIARDTFNLLQTSARAFEGYFKSLVTNTSLPDMMKQKARDLIYKSRTDKWGGMMASAMDKIRGKIFDKIKDSAKSAIDMLSTAAMAAESGADAYNMAREIGGGEKGGLPGWAMKGAGALAAWMPFNRFAKKHKGMFDAINSGAAGMRANLATTVAGWRERLAGSNNVLANMLADLLPNPFSQQTDASNDMLSKAKEAAVFDVITRQSIVEVIPSYLGKIWHEIAMMRTGDENLEERTFNIYQRKFTGVSELKADISEKAFTKESSRRNNLNQMLGTMEASAARNNGAQVTIGGKTRDVTNMYKGMEKDINRIFLNHALTGRTFNPAKIQQYVNDPSSADASYISAITEGVRGNVREIFEAICAALFTKEGKLDRQAFNKINLAITEKYRLQDQYRQTLAEVAETFGQGQFISGKLSARQEDELKELARSSDAEISTRAKAMLDENMGLLTRGVSGNRINMSAIAKERADLDYDQVKADEATRRSTYNEFQAVDEQIDSIRSSVAGFGRKVRGVFSRGKQAVSDAYSKGKKFVGEFDAPEIIGRAKDAGTRAAKGAAGSISRGAKTVMDKATGFFSVAGRGRGAEYDEMFTDTSSKSRGETLKEQASAIFSGIMSSLSKGGAAAREAFVKMSGGEPPPAEPSTPTPPTQEPPQPTPPPTEEPSIAASLNASLGTPDQVVEEGFTNIKGEVFDNILDELRSWREESVSNQGTIFDAVAQIDETIRGLKITGAVANGTIALGAEAPPRTLGGMLKQKLKKPIGKIGSAIKNVGKAYVSIYSAALKGAGTAIAGAANFAKDVVGKVGRGIKGVAKWATGEKQYVDVYVKGKENRPIVSARMQREEGIFFKSNGKRVERSSDIDQECVDKDGNLVITEEDLNAGLIMPNGTPLGKLGRGLLSLGKSYFGLYGKALGAIGVIGKAAISALFGAKAEKYVDIYRKDEIAKGPLVTARQQKNEGVFFFDDHKRVEKSSDIHGPVVNAKGEVVITKEDIEHGLVDVNNKPIGTSKTGLLNGTGGLLAGIGTAIGAGAKSMLSIYTKVYKNAIDLISGGIKGAGKFLGRALGLDMGKGGLAGEGDKEIRDAILGSYSTLKIIQADLALIANQYRPEGNPLDKDGDGYTDGAAADRRQKAEEKKQAEEEAKAKAANKDADGDGDIDGSYKDQMARRNADAGKRATIDHKDVDWSTPEEAEAAAGGGDGSGGGDSWLKRKLWDKASKYFGKKLGRGKDAWKWARKLRVSKYLAKKRAGSAVAKGGKAILSGGKTLFSKIGGKLMGKGLATAATGGLASTAAGAGTAAAGTAASTAAGSLAGTLGSAAAGTAGTAAATGAAGAAGTAATTATGGAVAHGLGAGLKTVVGKSALPIALALEAGIGGYKAYGAYKQGKLNKGDDTVGRTTNAMIGTALGAAIGSIVPGLGTALGAAIGGAVGGLGGGMVKKNLITGIIKAVRGNDNEMTEKEIEYGRRKLQRKVDKNVPGYDRILQEYEKAVEAKNWARARGLCGKEADSAITALWKNSWTGQLVNGTINLMFGDKNAEMTKEEIDKTRAKFQSIMKKGGMAAKNAERLLDKFDDYVAEGNWKEARKIAGAEKRGLFGKLFQDSKGNIQWGRLIGGIALGPVGYLIGSWFDKTDENKPMSESEIKEAIAWFDKQAAAGGKTKEKIDKIKEEFQTAVTEQNWKKARKLCGKEVRSAWSKTWGALKTTARVATAIGTLGLSEVVLGFFGDQETPMTDAEIKNFRDKMGYLITKKGDKLAERKLEKFDEYVARQQWEKARKIAKMEHKGWVVRAAKAYHAFWWGDDEAAMSEAEVQKARESMQRKIKLGIKGAQKKLDAFEDAVGTQKWRKARAIAKMPDEGVMQKTGKGLAIAARYFWGGNDQYMDNDEIEKARKIMQNAIKDGKKGAQRRLDMFEDAVADENWKKARYLARMPYETMGKRIKNWWLGGDKHKALDPDEIEEFRSVCEAAIANGNKNARKKLEDFNAAVADENWEKARKISQIKDEGAWGSVKSGAKKFWNWLTGNKDRKDCEEMREELEEKAMEDNTGILNAGLDQFNAYVRRRQFNQAIALGKDMLKMKPHEFAKKHKFSTEKLKKLSKDAQELAAKIQKEYDETSWTSPWKLLQLSGLRKDVLNNSEQWGDEFFNEAKDKLAEITDKADYLSEGSKEGREKEIERGKELLETIKKQRDKRSWSSSFMTKWRLGSLYNEVKSNVMDWDDTMFDIWEDKLEEIDDDYQRKLDIQPLSEGDEENPEKVRTRKNGLKLLRTIIETRKKYNSSSSPFVVDDLSALYTDLKSTASTWTPKSIMSGYQRLMEADTEGKANLRDADVGGDLMNDPSHRKNILNMKAYAKFDKDIEWLKSKYPVKYNDWSAREHIDNFKYDVKRNAANASNPDAYWSNVYAVTKKYFDDDNEIEKANYDWNPVSMEQSTKEEVNKTESEDRKKVVALWNKFVDMINDVNNQAAKLSPAIKEQANGVYDWITGWIRSRVGNAFNEDGKVKELRGKDMAERKDASPGYLLTEWQNNTKYPPQAEVVKKQVALAIKKLSDVVKAFKGSITKVDGVDLDSLAEGGESAQDVEEHNDRTNVWMNLWKPYIKDNSATKEKVLSTEDPVLKAQLTNDMRKLNDDIIEYQTMNLPGGKMETWVNYPKEPPTAKEFRSQLQKWKARLRKLNPDLYKEEAEELDQLNTSDEPAPTETPEVDGNKIRKAIEFYGPIEVQNRPWLANIDKFGNKAAEDAAAQNYAGVPSRDDIIAEYSKMQNEQAAEGDALAKKVGEDVGKDAKPTGPTIDMIGGEPVGEQLTPKQMRTIERGLDNGRKYSKEILDKYHNQRSDKEFLRLNNLKSMDEVREAEAPPPPEPWELDIEGFYARDDEGNPTETHADQCSIAGEKIGAKLSAKQVAAIKQGLEKGEKYPGWLMKRYRAALSESKSEPTNVGEQASADLGTSPSNDKVPEYGMVRVHGRQIYVWKDGTGKVHHTSKPPSADDYKNATEARKNAKRQQAESKVRFDGGVHPSSEEEEEEESESSTSSVSKDVGTKDPSKEIHELSTITMHGRTLYVWKDGDGKVHRSHTRPAGSEGMEAVDYRVRLKQQKEAKAARLKQEARANADAASSETTAGEQAESDVGKKNPEDEVHELSSVQMHGSTIYIWKDGNGKIHRSRTRPTGSEGMESVDYRVRQKQQQETTASSTPQATSAGTSAQADVGTSSSQTSQDSFTDEDVNKCIDAFIIAGHDLLSTPVGKFIKFADVYVREKLGITQVTTSVRFNARASKLIQERIKSGKLTPTTETKSVQSQARSDVGTPSNKEALAAQNKRIKERMESARLTPHPKPTPETSPEAAFGLGGFINKLMSGIDADGKQISIGEEGDPEAIVPLVNKPGNLLNKLGAKIKELISGKAPTEGEVPDQASVHATDKTSEPLISKLAKQVVNAAGLGMPDTLSNIGKKMQDFFKAETAESLTPSEAGAPSIFERIKNGVVNLTDGLLSKPSEAIRGMLSTEEERPEDLSVQTQQPPSTTPAPSTVEFKEAGELLKSQGAMTNQVKEMTEAAVKLFSLMSEAFTKSGIKVQGIDTLAQICAMGATARNDQPASGVQVVRTPPDNESGIDLRKRQS